MKSFIEFLKESKIDQELDSSDEKLFSITENSIEEVNEGDEMSFAEIADANMEDEITEAEEDKEDKEKIAKGFGDEVYISINPKKMMNEEQKTRAEKSKEREDSKTLKYLKASQDKRDDQEDMDKLIDRLTNYIIDKDGYTLLVKDEKTGERRPITQDEIDVIVKRKNSKSAYAPKSYYDITDDGRLITVSKNDPSKRRELQERYRKGVLKRINDKVTDQGIHYNWKDGSSIIQRNSNSWDDSDKRNNKRFDNIEYKPIDLSVDKDIILNILNKKESDKEKPIIGFKDGHWTQDEKPMTDEQLKSFVKILNGQIGGTTKLMNPKSWGKEDEDYWESYKVSAAGSKVGNALNFNLPPIKTCHKGELPCAKLCYAVKAYGAKPAVRGATECNFALLKRDKGFELFKKSMIYALNTEGRNGKKFDLCRVHVSGDFYSSDYLKAICEIAKECSHVRFWMYTKQYEILHAFDKSAIPSNLCIIVSCWGDYNPFDFKEGKYKSLAEDFPLAYLDDESEEFAKMNQRIQEFLGKPKDIQYCPCTMAEEIITRCESCQICFDIKKAQNNLVFKLH